MSKNKKRNIIIGSLCAVVLLMAVGYAAFQTVLNIQGTSNITSSWNVKITNVTSKNIVGTASNNGDPSFEELSATFKTSLQAPGDSIEYDITVTNAGNLDAKLDEITLSDTNNPAIKFTASGMTKGDVITAGSTKVLTVKVEYISSVSEQPTNTTSTLTVDLDYSQATGTTPSGESAADKLIGTAVTTGDGLYADSYEEGRYIYRGGTPNNYITFNEENAGWRILSVEADGTIKIIRDQSISDMAWDASNSNTWTRPATLNTYLNNDYYNSLTEAARAQITTGTFKIGEVTYNDTNLGNTVTIENNTTWSGNIALATVSEYVRTSNNSQCTSVNAYWGTSSCYSNGSTHNWLTKIMNSSTNKYSWLLSPAGGYSDSVFYVYSIGFLYNYSASLAAPGVAPVVYLKSDIQLSGEGTQSNPYTIG
ncbi:MAG: DUF6273 domain-containing protein [Bacilli bacterium]